MVQNMAEVNTHSTSKETESPSERNLWLQSWASAAGENAGIFLTKPEEVEERQGRLCGLCPVCVFYHKLMSQLAD